MGFTYQNLFAKFPAPLRKKNDESWNKVKKGGNEGMKELINRRRYKVK